MNKKEKVNEIKIELIKLTPFRRGCKVCYSKWHNSSMTFHHIIYKNGEKSRNDFADGYGGTLEYYNYITPIIKKYPKRFALLCNAHHQTITKILQFSVNKQDRIFRLVRKSRRSYR